MTWQLIRLNSRKQQQKLEIPKKKNWTFSKEKLEVSLTQKTNVEASKYVGVNHD